MQGTKLVDRKFIEAHSGKSKGSQDGKASRITPVSVEPFGGWCRPKDFASSDHKRSGSQSGQSQLKFTFGLKFGVLIVTIKNFKALNNCKINICGRGSTLNQFIDIVQK